MSAEEALQTESVIIDQDAPEVNNQEPKVTIPEKFMNQDGSINQDALLKSYIELEKMKSQPAVEPSTDSLEATSGSQEPLETTKVPETSEMKKALGDTLFNSLAEEYDKLGELSEDSYKKVEEQGFSKEFVDFYIDSLKAKVSQHQQEITKDIGGLDAYRQIQEWAKSEDAITQEDRALINELVSSKEVAKAKLGVRLLKEKYDNANGSSPSLVQGGAAQGSDVFANREEYAFAKGDKRYGVDPQYTRAVDTKLERSTYWR